VFAWHDQGKARASQKTSFLIKDLRELCPKFGGWDAKNRWFTLAFVASQRQATTASPAFDELVF
jgi:RNA polymerase subunit RPABC4/transcription elongation factor Spt4